MNYALKSEVFKYTTAAEDAVVESNLRDESMLEWWKKTSGLHTVEAWCSNYTKHPAGWGALLMIHGIPEVPVYVTLTPRFSAP